MSIKLNSNTFPNVPNLDGAQVNGTQVNGTQVNGTQVNGSQFNAPLNITGLNSSVIPLSLIIITVIIIIYYVFFASLGGTEQSTSDGSSSGNMLQYLLWGLFILLILLNGMTYIFNIDIIASIKHIFSPETQIDINVSQNNTLIPSSSGGLIRKKEVFHVSDNKYRYEDAKAICKAYDGRLANYNEINDAYNKGADWCGYGWSEGQMAFFPTQEEKWNKLQKIEGHEHDCGRPGINGGYIANPNVAFGVNCYGYKPAITNDEAEQMQNQQLYPKTNKEIMFDKKVDYWRSNLSDIMVSPFNSDNWSII